MNPVSYRLPPLNGLRAFEAAGRHLSFKLAAQELSVTPGAVSQQIKHLEQVLGVPLFQRTPHRLVLTGHGEAMLPVISDAFERMSAAMDAVVSTLPARALRLGVSPELTGDPQGLLTELANTGQAPDFIRATSTDDVSDLLSGALDAILRPGPGPYPGMHTEVLNLHRVFSPHSRASLVVWPGLAKCREFLKTRSLLCSPE
jgi:LysR family transcriptional regulator, glycine cleavage system transcriptional activator